MKRDLSHYLSLTYPMELVNEDGLWVAFHPDLPGCVSQGDSPNEAVSNLDDARETWLAARLEDGLPIEEPLNDEEFSGRISLRMPPYLHASLAQLSHRSDISLNQLLNNILSEYVGGRRTQDEVIRVMREEFANMGELLNSLKRQQLGGRINTDSSLGSLRNLDYLRLPNIQNLPGTTQ